MPALLMLLFLVKAQSGDAVSVLSRGGGESPPARVYVLTGPGEATTYNTLLCFSGPTIPCLYAVTIMGGYPKT